MFQTLTPSPFSSHDSHFLLCYLLSTSDGVWCGRRWDRVGVGIGPHLRNVVDSQDTRKIPPPSLPRMTESPSYVVFVKSFR